MGAAITARRLARGWLQRDLAERLGITPRAVGHLEHGRRWPSAEECRGLVEHLHRRQEGSL